MNGVYPKVNRLFQYSIQAPQAEGEKESKFKYTSFICMNFRRLPVSYPSGLTSIHPLFSTREHAPYKFAIQQLGSHLRPDSTANVEDRIEGHYI